MRKNRNSVVLALVDTEARLFKTVLAKIVVLLRFLHHFYPELCFSPAHFLVGFCRTGGTLRLSPTITALGMWWFTTGCFTTGTGTFCG